MHSSITEREAVSNLDSQRFKVMPMLWRAVMMVIAEVKNHNLYETSEGQLAAS